MDLHSVVAGPLAWAAWLACWWLALRYCMTAERLTRTCLTGAASLALVLLGLTALLGAQQGAVDSSTVHSSAVYLSVLGCVSAVGPFAALIDLREHRLPNRLVLITTAGGVFLGAVHALAAAEFAQFSVALGLAAVATVLLVVVALLAPRLVGMGDAKLAFVIALSLLLQGIVAALVGAYLGLAAAGAAAVFTMLHNARQRRARAGVGEANHGSGLDRGKQRTSVACGPYLVAAPWLAVLCGPVVAAMLGAT